MQVCWSLSWEYGRIDETFQSWFVDLPLSSLFTIFNDPVLLHR